MTEWMNGETDCKSASAPINYRPTVRDQHSPTITNYFHSVILCNTKLTKSLLQFL